MSKKESRPDFSYESNLLYAQKLYRKLPYKWLRTLIMIITNVLLWALIIVLFLYLIVPALALLEFNPPLVIFVISSVIIIWTATLTIRFTSKRRKFFSEFKKQFGSSGATLTRLSKPGVFKSSGKTDVLIETKNTAYEVMFLPTFSANRKLLINSDGITAYRIYPVFLGRLGMLCGFKPYFRKIKITFASSGKASEKQIKRVLLLNPAPKEFYTVNTENKRLTPSGPGERFPGYTIENVSSLMRLIDRDIECE